jgi:hypothetical protein
VVWGLKGLGGVLLSTCVAHANINFDPSSIPNLNTLLAPEIVRAIIETVGTTTDYRSYEPATPLGILPGISFGVEVTAAKLPDSFRTAVQQTGKDLGDLGFFPVPRIHLHKGITDRMDIGASAIRYKNYSILGGELKALVYAPEEGVSWAVRLSYTETKLDIIETQTWTPQVLISKRLAFADPYLGVGYQMVQGKITLPLEFMGFSLKLQGEGASQAAVAFTGLSLRVPYLGLTWVMEGSYSTAGAHALGTRIGFSY